MAHEIKGTLYRLRSVNGASWFVECDNLYELHAYIAQEIVAHNMIISNVCSIDPDGKTPKVAIMSDVRFKRVLIKYQNFYYAVNKLTENHYCVEFAECGSNLLGARVYKKNLHSKSFTKLEACNDTRQGYVVIGGKVQNIDEWIHEKN